MSSSASAPLLDNMDIHGDIRVDLSVDGNPPSTDKYYRECLEAGYRGGKYREENHGKFMTDLYSFILQRSYDGFSTFNIDSKDGIIPERYFYDSALQKSVSEQFKEWGFKVRFYSVSQWKQLPKIYMMYVDLNCGRPKDNSLI
jgi:hypothetical protein